MERYCEIIVKFDGMYAIGPGFLSGIAAYKWDNFFKTYNGNHWKLSQDVFGSTYLTSIHMGGLIHPMDGVHLVGVCPNYMKDYSSEINELNTILEKLCNECNGTFTLTHRIFTA